MPFDPYADTPEAREWTRKLKDEYVQRKNIHVCVKSLANSAFSCSLFFENGDGYLAWRWMADSLIEHHAILDAIYEVIKEK